MNKNVKSLFQEEANEISLCQFSKMSRWVEITSTPTNRCSTMTSWAADYGLKSRIPGEQMEIKSSVFWGVENRKFIEEIDILWALLALTFNPVSRTFDSYKSELLSLLRRDKWPKQLISDAVLRNPTGKIEKLKMKQKCFK